MALESKFKPFGQKILQWWAARPSVQALNLKTLRYGKNTQVSPVFPCAPVADLPRGYLRAYTEEHTYTGIGNCPTCDFTYTYSLFVQRLQAPGEEHQQLVMDMNAAFINPLLEYNFEPTISLAGLQLVSLVPLQGIVRDEMIHPLGSMRVSNGEIIIQAKGRLSAG